MKRRWVLIGIISLIALAGIYATVRLNPSEPSYQGKTLTQWLDQQVNSTQFGGNVVTESEFEQAIRNMGTNALPALIRHTSWRPSAGLIGWLAFKMPNWPRLIRFAIWSQRAFGTQVDHSGRDFMRARAASQAIILLGKDALPALRVLFYATQSRGYFMVDLSELVTAIGKDSVPIILNCFLDPRFSNHMALVEVIHRTHLGESAAPIVPFLCADLKRGNSSLSVACVGSLGNLGLNPGLAVPALIETLRGANQIGDYMLARKCAEALGKFGSNASNAVPILCQTLKSPGGITTEEAARALGKIGVGSEVAVPALIAYFRDSGGKHRKYAIEGLKGYGAAAGEAVPLLREALNDENHDTRALAKAVLDTFNQ